MLNAIHRGPHCCCFERSQFSDERLLLLFEPRQRGTFLGHDFGRRPADEILIAELLLLRGDRRRIDASSFSLRAISAPTSTSPAMIDQHLDPPRRKPSTRPAAGGRGPQPVACALAIETK